MYCVKCVKQKYESQLQRINKAPRVKRKANVLRQKRDQFTYKERRALIGVYCNASSCGVDRQRLSECPGQTDDRETIG